MVETATLSGTGLFGLISTIKSNCFRIADLKKESFWIERLARTCRVQCMSLQVCNLHIMSVAGRMVTSACDGAISGAAYRATCEPRKMTKYPKRLTFLISKRLSQREMSTEMVLFGRLVVVIKQKEHDFVNWKQRYQKLMGITWVHRNGRPIVFSGEIWRQGKVSIINLPLLSPGPVLLSEQDLPNILIFCWRWVN